MNTPGNIRSQQTKQTIAEVFLQLAEEKSIFKISVREICEKAKINRSTFYAYYVDIYDLIVKLEAEMAEQRQQCMYNEEEDHYQFIPEVILKHVRDNQRYYRLFYKNGNTIQLEKLSKTDYLIQKKEKYTETVQLIEKYEYLFAFYASGINGLIRR